MKFLKSKFLPFILILSLTFISAPVVSVQAGITDGIIDILCLPIDLATGITDATFQLVDTWEYWANELEKKYPDAVDTTNGTINVNQTNNDIIYNPDNDTYTFTQNFFNFINEKSDERVHALNGYYLFDTSPNPGREAMLDMVLEAWGRKRSDFRSFDVFDSFYSDSDFFFFYNRNFYKIDPIYCSSSLFIPSLTTDLYRGYLTTSGIFNYSSFSVPKTYIAYESYGSYYKFKPLNSAININVIKNASVRYGPPLKVFYSEKDLENYLKAGGDTHINAKVSPTDVTVSGSVLGQMADITASVSELLAQAIESAGGAGEVTTDTVGTLLQGILDDLFYKYLISQGSDNPPTPVPPTPTPDIGDDSKPTPTPGFGDGDITPTPGAGGTLDDTNSWLELIFRTLDTFAESFGKYGDEMFKLFLQSDTKLDDIVTALDKILSGTPSGESNGCKYDYTELSDFLTQLWDDSGGKLDSMIKLLEENNEYQKKIVNSLNQIKALLVADTVLDFFKDRSSETANKAKDKFPTSIPWDVAMIVNAMCAEPQTPIISCPIKIDSLNINEEIVIDLSDDSWTKLAKTCRGLLSILFILYLIHLTRELFFKGGDD